MSLNKTWHGGYGDIFKEHHVLPKKRLGQHFMADPGLLRSIAEIMVPNSNYVVLELGAGAGTLTRELCHRARWVHAIEMDRDLQGVASRITSSLDNLSWSWKDALETDLLGRDLALSYPEAPLSLCGNLPYYITSEILYRSLIPRSNWARMGFVVQLEVGERICARWGTKDYGRLSLWCQYRAKVSLEKKIPRGAFWPRPDVESCLVTLELMQNFPLDEDQEALMDALSKAAYSQRRKTILNGISTVLPHTPRFTLSEAIKASGLDPERRPESFGPDDFVTLTRALWPFWTQLR
jgi:16S rRNA (adenine1518-N6/adenine1519-N6)-dimethyltransferase